MTKTRFGTAAYVQRITCAAAVAVGAVALSSSTSAATLRFDNTGGDGLWETANNWLDGTDATRHVPVAADIADISNSYTASISSAQTVTEVQVGHPNSTAGTLPGTATLNILPGTNLQSTSTNGVRIGRAVQAGQLPGSSLGFVNQTGGTFTITAGTNGLRLSQADSGTVADSLYRISGGSVLGGSTLGSMTAPLQIGNLANAYNSAEFHMNGSGVTAARFEDVRMQASTAATGTRNTILHFTLDAGGVTTLVAEDEMRFAGTGNNQLVIDMSGLAPETDITLISADRLTTASSAPAETFTGMPHGTPIVRQFGGYEYTWNLLYQDASDNGVLDASVVLDFVSKTEIVPEPGGLALLGLSGLTLLRRRSRS